MFKVEVKIQAAGLEALMHRLQRPEPLMRGISLELRSLAEKAFAAEGSPEKWASLSNRTISARAKRGQWPGRILQVSGKLAASVSPFSSGAEAGIYAGSGPSAKYAAIHQFGGMAGRGKKVSIPARPFLPMNKGGLTKDAERSILGLTIDYLNGPAA